MEANSEWCAAAGSAEDVQLRSSGSRCAGRRSASRASRRWSTATSTRVCASSASSTASWPSSCVRCLLFACCATRCLLGRCALTRGLSGHPREARDRGGVEGEDADGRPRRRVRPSLRSLRCSLAGGRPPPSDLGLRRSNKRSYVSFATSGKDSRTTQMFIKCAGPPTHSLRPSPLRPVAAAELGAAALSALQLLGQYEPRRHGLLSVRAGGGGDGCRRPDLQDRREARPGPDPGGGQQVPQEGVPEADVRLPLATSRTLAAFNSACARSWIKSATVVDGGEL